MRVTQEQFAEHNERIRSAASALFRQHGFDGVGVADIMKAAGLTHGGFYGHFDSKDELVAEASREALEHAHTRWIERVAAAPRSPLKALADHYLSERQITDPAHGCALTSLSADASRRPAKVRAVFTAGVESLTGVLMGVVRGRTRAAKRRRALATLSQMVGAVVLARAVDDAALARELLEAASHQVLTES